MQNISIYFNYTQINLTTNQTQTINLKTPLNISIPNNIKITKSYIQNQFKNFISTLSNSHSYKLQNKSNQIQYTLNSTTYILNSQIITLNNLNYNFII